MTGYVVTGTDTGIGKTVFAAGLTAHLGGAYWKPVQAGLEEGSDNDTVRQLSGLPAAHFFPESYRLNTPCSPHRAAELDGVSINPDHLVPPLCDVSLVIEGAGGVLVPITRQICYADIFARWALPVILVARTSLGTINHSLLSIEALRLRDVPIHGVAFIGDANEDSEATICEMGGVRRLGRLPTLSPLNTQTLGAAFSQAFARSFLREDLV